MHAMGWRRSTGKSPSLFGKESYRQDQVRVLSTLPTRLNQQQLSELRAQVEDLQKALQEQGAKAEDVSAHLLPAWPS